MPARKSMRVLGTRRVPPPCCQESCSEVAYLEEEDRHAGEEEHEGVEHEEGHPSMLPRVMLRSCLP